MRVSYVVSISLPQFSTFFSPCFTSDLEDYLPKWNVARLVSPDSRDTDTSSALATKEMQIHAKTTPGTTNTAVAGNYNTDWTAAMSFMDRGIPVHGFLVAIVVRALGG